MIPWLLLASARAHAPGLSNASVDDGVLALSFSFVDLEPWVPLSSPDAAGAILAATLADVSITADGLACTLGDGAIARVGDGVRVSAPVACPTSGRWTLDLGFLSHLPPSHRTVVDVSGVPVATLSPAEPRTELDAVASAPAVSLHYAALGVEHILAGPDHLAFVLGLVLSSARRARDLALLVTAFTVAHSITLGIAVLGWVTVNPRWVEPVIALSVAWIGKEALQGTDLSGRWLLTFAFGLVHGFGFAGVLAGLGLPSSQLVNALLSFNVGVEVGQGLAVLAMWPLLAAMAHPRALGARARTLVGGALVVAGLAWLVSRLLA